MAITVCSRIDRTVPILGAGQRRPLVVWRARVDLSGDGADVGRDLRLTAGRAVVPGDPHSLAERLGYPEPVGGLALGDHPRLHRVGLFDLGLGKRGQPNLDVVRAVALEQIRRAVRSCSIARPIACSSREIMSSASALIDVPKCSATMRSSS